MIVTGTNTKEKGKGLIYLQSTCQEVVLRYNVYEEVCRNLCQLVIQDRDDLIVQIWMLQGEGLCTAQKIQQILPLFKPLVDVTQKETHEGEL